MMLDGGNSYYKKSRRRAKYLRGLNVFFLDVGVSVGVYGEELGYCLMVGGERPAFERVEHILRDLSYEGVVYAHSKIVHNGIEYAFMQAIGEGFELFKESGFNYDLKEGARIYDWSLPRRFLRTLATWKLSSLMWRTRAKGGGLKSFRDRLLAGLRYELGRHEVRRE